MTSRKRRSQEIRQALLAWIDAEESQPAALASTRFGISRQAASRYLRSMRMEGLIHAVGNTKARRWVLTPIENRSVEFALEGLEEDEVFRGHVLPLLQDCPDNVKESWQYGVTEIINNAIDHSGGTTLRLDVRRDAVGVTVAIRDNGEGIFHKIAKALHLVDERQAILELAKGKFTTDPAKHTGEGIFFTSRAMDHFVIHSGELHFAHDDGELDIIFDGAGPVSGTLVQMRLRSASTRNIEELFLEFAAPDEYAFSKTIVPVRLAKHEGETLVSRSQAKRLVARFERFKQVILDFSGVQSVGQAFADEVFRVFAKQHPEVLLVTMHVTPAVAAMINRALANAAEERTQG